MQRLYCLMSNHFRLLPRPEPSITISRVLQSPTVAQTWRFHRRHRTGGHLWQGRFKAPVVQEDGHLRAVLRDIEANPTRAGIVADPADYPWSSYPAQALGRPDPLLTPPAEWSDLGSSDSSRRVAWRRKMRGTPPAGRTDPLRGGLPYGDPAWVESSAVQLGRPLQRRRPGRPRKAET